MMRGHDRARSARRLVLALAVTAATAGAAAADDDPRAAIKQDKKKAKAAAKKKAGDTLEVTGRVFAKAVAAAEDSAPWQSELKLASARIGVDYQWRKQLRAELSYEAAKKSVRDAYVQLELGHGIRIRAGRFKLPLGTIEQTSTWTLPTTERGLVADILADGLAATGRRSALAVRWRGAGAWRPTVEVAVAQLTRLGLGEQVGPVADGGGLTAVVRAEVSPCPMYRLAIAGSNRAVVDFVGVTDRYWTGSIEAEIDLADAGLGLRLWGDAVLGQSHLGAARFGDPIMPFAAGHVIAGYRFGGADRSDTYVEPYLGAGWFNPVLGHARDDVSEVVVGVAGGRWRRWRVQGQFAYQNARSSRPAQLLVDQDVNDRLTVTTQLGTAF